MWSAELAYSLFARRVSLQAGCCHSSQRQLYSVQAAKALESTQQRKDDLLLSKIVKTACNMLSRTRGSQNVEVPDEESAPRSTCPKLPNLATGFTGPLGSPLIFRRSKGACSKDCAVRESLALSCCQDLCKPKSSEEKTVG